VLSGLVVVLNVGRKDISGGNAQNLEEAEVGLYLRQDPQDHLLRHPDHPFLYIRKDRYQPVRASELGPIKSLRREVVFIVWRRRKEGTKILMQ